MFKKTFFFQVIGFFCILYVLCYSYSCESEYYPKPKGYFRIELPEKKYQVFDSVYPYTFQYPVYANIKPDLSKHAEPYWINIDFPKFKARVHISYKPVKNNLVQYLEDSRTFVMKHIPKATDIRERIIENDSARVFGLFYNINGIAAASSSQFYLTDSTKHFVRGALYFNVSPNNDSLAPVIRFINADIEHMINTFAWKQKTK